MVKNCRKPKLSNNVVTNGPLISAGSRLKRLKVIGNSVPSITATILLEAITIPATTATQRTYGGVNSKANTVIKLPKQKAIPKLAANSRLSTWSKSAGVTSPTPKERIVTVKA
jgi:hypothetical protein